MAKTKGINKSQLIREILSQEPNTSAKDVVDRLARAGHKVSVNLVYSLKSGSKKKFRRRKARAHSPREGIAKLIVGPDTGGVRYIHTPQPTSSEAGAVSWKDLLESLSLKPLRGVLNQYSPNDLVAALQIVDVHTLRVALEQLRIEGINGAVVEGIDDATFKAGVPLVDAATLGEIVKRIPTHKVRDRLKLLDPETLKAAFKAVDPDTRVAMLDLMSKENLLVGIKHFDSELLNIALQRIRPDTRAVVNEVKREDFLRALPDDIKKQDIIKNYVQALLSHLAIGNEGSATIEKFAITRTNRTVLLEFIVKIRHRHKEALGVMYDMEQEVRTSDPLDLRNSQGWRTIMLSAKGPKGTGLIITVSLGELADFIAIMAA